MIAGLALYVVATAACAVAPTFSWLLAARFLQGFTSGVGPSLRAIARDFATEIAGARLMSLLTAVVGTVPLLAPLVGAALLEHTDWRGIFWLTGAIGTVWFLIATARLPETRPADAPRFDFGTVAQDTRDVVGTRVPRRCIARRAAVRRVSLDTGAVSRRRDRRLRRQRVTLCLIVRDCCCVLHDGFEPEPRARRAHGAAPAHGRRRQCLAGAALSVIGVTRPALVARRRYGASVLRR